MEHDGSKSSHNPFQEDGTVFDPFAPPLNADETRAACQALIQHPRVLRSERDPPVEGQACALVSMRLFAAPFRTPSGAAVYGLLKVRATTPNTDCAKSKCGQIIREVDSKDRISIVEVGGWVPITDSLEFCRQQLDAKTEDTEVALRDLALEEKRNREARVARELVDKAERIKQEPKHDKGFEDTAQFYTTKRVLMLSLEEQISQQELQIQNNRRKIRELCIWLKRQQERFPNYDSLWLETYNASRREVGLSAIAWTEQDQTRYQDRLSGV